VYKNIIKKSYKLNKKEKKNFGILIISFLILIFIFNQNLFKKFYNIINTPYEHRVSKMSGFCSKDSIGYLIFLKKKFNFKFNPMVINYDDSYPDSNWPIYDTRLKNDPTHKILLNYPDELSLEFFPYKNNFYTTNTLEYGKGISEIYFDLKVPAININTNLVIYTKIFGSDIREIIYNKPFKELVKNHQKIELPYNVIRINNIYKPIFLEIEQVEKDKINNIKIIVKNQFDLNKFKILDSHENCYYIK
jgi:hypothetical protein